MGSRLPRRQLEMSYGMNGHLGMPRDFTVGPISRILDFSATDHPTTIRAQRLLKLAVSKLFRVPQGNAYIMLTPIEAQ